MAVMFRKAGAAIVLVSMWRMETIKTKDMVLEGVILCAVLQSEVLRFRVETSSVEAFCDVDTVRNA